MSEDTHKTCKKCGVIKPLTQYSHRPYTVDQYLSYCKACYNFRQKIDRKKHNTVIDFENQMSDALIRLSQSQKWSQ